MQGRLRKKDRKSKRKKSVQKDLHGQTFTDAKDMVKHLYELIRSIIKHLEYKVKIRVKNLDITVATKDAATTAITYSLVCNTLSVLIELLTGFDKIKCRIGKVDCSCDYLSESFSASVDIVLKIKILHTFSVLVNTLMNELKKAK